MGQAIRCDLTGKLEKGAGTRIVQVPLGDLLRLDVKIMVKSAGPGREYTEGRLSAEGADSIRNALSGVKPARGVVEELQAEQQARAEKVRPQIGPEAKK